MPDRNIAVQFFPIISSSSTTLQTSYENSSSAKSTTSDEELYNASVDFLRQHLKRKSGSDLICVTKQRKYSDTLLFEYAEDTKPKMKFLRLRNVEKFDKLLKLENSLPSNTLSNAQILPSVKKQVSNIRNLFKSKNKDSIRKSQSNNPFFNILRKLSPKSSTSNLEYESKSDESISGASTATKMNYKRKSNGGVLFEMGTPTISSNSSFPSFVATIPSELIHPIEDLDNKSSFIITNIWPPKEQKLTHVIQLPDIIESTGETSTANTTTSTENLEITITYKNKCCMNYSDSEVDLPDHKIKVRRQMSKLSVCTDSDVYVYSDSDYTDLSTDDEEEQIKSSASLSTVKFSEKLIPAAVFQSDQRAQSIVDSLLKRIEIRRNCPNFIK